MILQLKEFVFFFASSKSVSNSLPHLISQNYQTTVLILCVLYNQSILLKLSLTNPCSWRLCTASTLGLERPNRHKQQEGISGRIKHERVTKRYYWPRVTQDVPNFINSCHKCQVVKEVHLHKANTKLHSVVVPNKTWHQIAIDLMVGLKPGPYGHRNILTVIDYYFTKWPEIIPLKTKTAKEVAYHLYKVMYWYRCPEVIIYDWGMFTHHFLKLNIQQSRLHIWQ